jgi:methionine-rich copper-binding protein CopC
VIASGGLLACVLALLTALALPAFAQAAPQYQDSEPGAGASVQNAPDHVSVTFNEPLDDSSNLTVVNECGKNVDNGVVTVSLNEMSVGLDEAHYSGTYRVAYTAVGLGGVTGTTNGSFTFDAAEGHPCDGGGDHDHDDDKDHKDHDKKDHSDHNDHENREHDGMDHGDEHSDHTDMTHTGHSTEMDGSGHGHGAEGDHDGTHDARTGHSEHEGADADHRMGSPDGDQAAGLLPKLPADGKAVLIALGLCAAMGVIGGLFLRANTN